MTGQNDTDWIGADGATDGLGGHFGDATFFGDLKGNGLISCRLAERYVFHDGIDFFLERRNMFELIFGSEIGSLTAEIDI